MNELLFASFPLSAVIVEIMSVYVCVQRVPLICLFEFSFCHFLLFFLFFSSFISFFIGQRSISSKQQSIHISNRWHVCIRMYNSSLPSWWSFAIDICFAPMLFLLLFFSLRCHQDPTISWFDYTSSSPRITTVVIDVNDDRD